MCRGRGVGNYILGRTLGEGAFAKVKVARHAITGSMVAVKMINKTRTTDEYVLRNLHPGEGDAADAAAATPGMLRCMKYSGRRTNTTASCARWPAAGR